MPGRDLFAGTSKTSGGSSSGGRGGGRDLFAGSPHSGRGSKKHHGGGGFLGGVGQAVTNLATGAEQAVLGIPNAAETVFGSAAHDIRENPWLVYAGPASFIPGEIALGATGNSDVTKRVVVPLAKSYQYKYGPLIHGDVGKTLHRAFVEDPFGTILDLAVVLKPLKLADAGAALREIPFRGPEALAQSGRLDKQLAGVKDILPSESPVVAGGRVVRGRAPVTSALHSLLNLAPADAPLVGELRRFNRAIAQLPQKAAARRRLSALPLDRALRPLNAAERQAVGLIGRWPLPRLLDAQIEQWRQIGDETGALQIATDPKVRALYDHPNAKIEKALAEAKRLGEAEVQLLGEYGKLTTEAAAAHPYMHMRLASGATFQEGEGKAQVLTGGDTIDALKQELAAADRPEPVYLHDTALARDNAPTYRPATGGGTSPIPKSPVKQSLGKLSRTGQLLLDPASLVGQHARVVKYALYRDIHAHLEEIAVHIPKGARRPDGWEYVRRAVGPTGSAAERIGYTEKTAGDFYRQLDEMLPLGDKSAEAELGGQLTTRNATDAAETAQGDRLIVPSSSVKALSGEFARSETAVRWLIERPLDVWRWLLLNWSPRWLANNLVGNTFMALVRFGGVKFVRAWLAAVREHGGPAAIDKLLKDAATTRGLTAPDIADLFSEQVVGTFKAQNMPSQFEASAAVGRLKRIAREGLTPIDRGYEQALRRAAINAVAQKTPEVTRLYKQMPRQTRQWRAATKKALHENPLLAKKISQDIDSGLGNYSNMTPFERNWLRRLVPFYGWYRAITVVTLRLPLEIPLRAALIAKLAQLQQEDQDLLNPGLPPWIRGAIPFGANGALLTQGLNPYTTVPQVGRAADFAAAGGTSEALRNFLGVLNPELQSIGQLQPRYGEKAPGIPEALYQTMIGGLPPVRAAQLALNGAPPSKTYEPSERDQWLSLFGVPIRHLQQPIRR